MNETFAEPADAAEDDSLGEAVVAADSLGDVVAAADDCRVVYLDEAVLCSSNKASVFAANLSSSFLTNLLRLSCQLVLSLLMYSACFFNQTLSSLSR